MKDTHNPSHMATLINPYTAQLASHKILSNAVVPKLLDSLYCFQTKRHTSVNFMKGLLHSNSPKGKYSIIDL